MEKMELYDYYNLDECVDRKKVISVLKKLKKLQEDFKDISQL